MAWLAEGSSAMVVTPIVSGSIVLLISAFVDPLFGLGPSSGAAPVAASGCCCVSATPRKIPKTPASWWRPSTGASFTSDANGPRTVARVQPLRAMRSSKTSVADRGRRRVLDPFETEQRFAEVNDERDDDVWCLRLAVGPSTSRCTAHPWPGRSWPGTPPCGGRLAGTLALGHRIR